ncbi:MAG: DNA mismatch repair endonuclease MutL [Lewinellaceae bacterium]|nr:DNA mismatch repair endonuclease MutL [Saprospiraceae bacterium]MCB9331407.1 DNA mismatch repair endonuclease MutL [Lewinellaceae bacterium]
MTNVIQLLPESVANQIAAGEVVQRPSSIVKELMENAIDAGATQVKLIVRDAGKTLVQVVDDGCGMSETDARMCFERHATSKIRESKDLFEIKTMGFRGEALASISAVAKVELRTRRAIDELGTRVLVEDSAIKTHEPCQAPAGTSIAVKSLFYNVPARRNFLKSDPVEMRHILDEFQRIALANPDIFFSLHHNDQEMFHLPPGNLRQRIVKVFGEAVNKKLVPVQEETDVLKISGFVGKPDYYKKSRGEQLFFVNKRFIKSNYLQHAVVSAYEQLLPTDTFPLFVLFLEIAPGSIDINVHPTKQQIKFDDEKLVYNYLKVTVRHALGSHSITPTLDFEQEPAFQATSVKQPTLHPPGGSQSSVRDYPSRQQDRLADENLRNWQRLYEGLDLADSQDSTSPSILPSGASADVSPGKFDVRPGAEPTEMDDDSGSFSKGQKEPYQVHGMYIVSQIKSGFLLIDQQAASERILYERYLEALRQQPVNTQKALFPKNIDLSPADATLLRDILPEVNRLGFDIAEFGGNTFIVHGAPSDIGSGLTEEALLERLLTQYKNNLELELGISENLARSMARSAALKRGQLLSVVEMQDLIDHLFACAAPYKSPNGRTCFITFELDELQKRFNS